MMMSERVVASISICVPMEELSRVGEKLQTQIILVKLLGSQNSVRREVLFRIRSNKGVCKEN
jgi:archaellum biogenesis ATPase FlaH